MTCKFHEIFNSITDTGSLPISTRRISIFSGMYDLFQCESEYKKKITPHSLAFFHQCLDFLLKRYEINFSRIFLFSEIFEEKFIQLEYPSSSIYGRSTNQHITFLFPS